MTRMSVYAALGVRRVVNACGVYTDLGGSVLGPAAWDAAAEANRTWAAIDELLDGVGARIAALCGAPRRLRRAGRRARGPLRRTPRSARRAQAVHRRAAGRRPGQRRARAGRRASELEAALAAGDPSVRTMVNGDAIVLCTEA